MTACLSPRKKFVSRMGLSAAFVLGLGITAAAAQDETPGEKLDQALRDTERAAERLALRAEELARDAAVSARQMAQSALEAVDDAVRDLPQYEAPTVDENGDIIIRRKREPEDDLIL